MLDKIKFKLLVVGGIIVIISLFTIFLTWVGVSLWWLVSGCMVSRITFIYIYTTLTLIPLITLGVGTLKTNKK